MRLFFLHSLATCLQFGFGDLVLSDVTIRTFISKIWAILWQLWRATLRVYLRKTLHGTYANEGEEQAYWESAIRSHLYLQTSGAMKVWSFPVITSYAPAPPVSTSQEDEPESIEYYLPSKTFCKWHRMVFPESPNHPTLSQARMLKKYFSSLDRREMHRISQLLSDDVVFGTHKCWGSKYRTLWNSWLEKKGADIAIVFAKKKSMNQ
ncbi:uncharacterized protein BT62DRAFT_974516 [Guyanagaster necrorhizus]|uniref:Uncharacterized protein n=1 Tax=Guyanagaster necrorhizus TaxID=856835 RepID=A0A9P7VJD0_9AGAR|nr:uncharacterized protein BT62DRAFT_974516 [Guyanagaster necrorhizus MCA 3950]KAG7441623.1 hypothetical protein BT62DRAFT_974516 [Guyanagaster necrorhizus MCA 3950]